MTWQVGVMAIQMDATFQVRLLLIVKGHHIAIHSIGEAVEFRNLQGFGPQLYDATIRFQNVHMERKHLHVCLCLSKPGQNTQNHYVEEEHEREKEMHFPISK